LTKTNKTYKQDKQTKHTNKQEIYTNLNLWLVYSILKLSTVAMTIQKSSWQIQHKQTNKQTRNIYNRRNFLSRHVWSRTCDRQWLPSTH